MQCLSQPPRDRAVSAGVCLVLEDHQNSSDDLQGSDCEPCMQVWVTVPEIAVSMDAQEFHILQDVAASLATEQVGSQPASLHMHSAVCAIYCD